jgi:hypothetical protein
LPRRTASQLAVLPDARRSRLLSLERAEAYTRRLPYLTRLALPRGVFDFVSNNPALALLVPLTKIIPPVYRGRVRSRIHRWYARLKEAELELEVQARLV